MLTKMAKEWESNPPGSDDTPTGFEIRRTTRNHPFRLELSNLCASPPNSPGCATVGFSRVAV